MTNVFLTGSPSQGTDQPAGPAVPAIPTFDGTPDGLDSTVNSLVDAVRLLSGQRPFPNNQDTQNNGPGNSGSNSAKAKQGNNDRFTEISRQTQDVKVTNPSDSTQYVMVRQITKLVMQDTVTKEQWIWTL